MRASLTRALKAINQIAVYTSHKYLDTLHRYIAQILKYITPIYCTDT